MSAAPWFPVSGWRTRRGQPLVFPLLLSLLLIVMLTGCSRPDAPVLAPPADPMERAEYRGALERLAALNRQAQEHWTSGDRERAAQLLTEAQPLAKQLLEVRRPPLAAFEAASDFDQLYAHVLLAKRHTVWARQLYVTNAVRWRNWKPETEDTLRRRREAEEGIAACDKAMGLD